MKISHAEPLLGSFYKLLFISLGASVFLSYIIFFIPLNASFQKEQENYFVNEVKIKAHSNEHLILDYISMVEAMGSRTVIRQKLAEYHQGNVELEELKIFTQPKFEDSVAVIRNLIGASRHLPDGTMIASWGDMSVYTRHQVNSAGFHLIKENGNLLALVVSFIKENGTVIGYDAGVFNADILVKGDPKLVRSFDIIDNYNVENDGNRINYVIPIHEEKFLLVAQPYEEIFKRATLKAFSFVSMYSFALFILISFFSYITFFKFVQKIIGEHVCLNEKANTLLAEKVLVLKEVHHRIKNNLNTVSSLLSFQASKTSEPMATLALEDARNRIQSMSILYDKLYRSQDYAELSAKNYLSSLVDEIVANFPNNQMVRVEKNIQEFNLDIKHLQSLGIMINELITNIMKYAFKDRNEGLVIVSVTKNNEQVMVSVQDDGIGIPESISFENSTGFGLQLVDGLVQQLEGTIRIERGNGTKVVVEFNI